MITFRCNRCGQKVAVKPNLAGQHVRCPRCRAKARVPDASPDSAERIAPAARSLSRTATSTRDRSARPVAPTRPAPTMSESDAMFDALNDLASTAPPVQLAEIAPPARQWSQMPAVRTLAAFPVPAVLRRAPWISPTGLPLIALALLLYVLAGRLNPAEAEQIAMLPWIAALVGALLILVGVMRGRNGHWPTLDTIRLVSALALTALLVLSMLTLPIMPDLFGLIMLIALPLVVLSIVGMIACNLWAMGLVLREGLGQLVLYLVVPLYAPLYTLNHWREMQHPVKVSFILVQMMWGMICLMMLIETYVVK